MAKNGHNAKAIAHAKYSVWIKKLNCLKHARNVSTNTLELLYAKNGWKKTFPQTYESSFMQKWLEKKANIQKSRAI